MSAKKQAVLIAVFAALSAAWTWGAEIGFRSSGATELRFLDVGQGDAMLIRDPDGRTLLLDAGPNAAVLEGLAEALPFWRRRLDAALVTHLDADHFKGLFWLFRRYEIGELATNGAAPTTPDGRGLLFEAEARGIPHRAIGRGEVFRFRDASLEIIHPEPLPPGSLARDENELSLVAVFRCDGGGAALLTGDIGVETELALLEAGLVEPARVLKVGHHGSARSTHPDLLDAVRPELAVISVGARNRYGHPAPRVLADLLSRGVAVHRTDRDGPVVLACGADGLKVR